MCNSIRSYVSGGEGNNKMYVCPQRQYQYYFSNSCQHIVKLWTSAEEKLKRSQRLQHETRWTKGCEGEGRVPLLANVCPPFIYSLC